MLVRVCVCVCVARQRVCVRWLTQSCIFHEGAKCLEWVTAMRDANWRTNTEKPIQILLQYPTSAARKKHHDPAILIQLLPV